MVLYRELQTVATGDVFTWDRMIELLKLTERILLWQAFDRAKRELAMVQGRGCILVYGVGYRVVSTVQQAAPAQPYQQPPAPL